jgi:hypothetical protein
MDPIFDEEIKKARADPDIEIMGALSTDEPGIFLLEGSPAAFNLYQVLVRSMERLWQARAERIWNLERAHDERMRRQLDLVNLFSSPAPALYLREVFTKLAGTDYRSHEELLETARRYRSGMLRIFRAKGYFDNNAIGLISRVPPDEAFSLEKFQRRRDMPGYGENLGLDKLPPLPGDLLPESASVKQVPRFQESLQPAAILVLMVFLFFSIGQAAFIRYDVR